MDMVGEGAGYGFGECRWKADIYKGGTVHC